MQNVRSGSSEELLIELSRTGKRSRSAVGACNSVYSSLTERPPRAVGRNWLADGDARVVGPLAKRSFRSGQLPKITEPVIELLAYAPIRTVGRTWPARSSNGAVESWRDDVMGLQRYHARHSSGFWCLINGRTPFKETGGQRCCQESRQDDGAGSSATGLLLDSFAFMPKSHSPAAKIPARARALAPRPNPHANSLRADSRNQS